MAGGSIATAEKKCINCGFGAPAESDEWDSVNHPPLGTLTQCPECGSTNIVDSA